MSDLDKPNQFMFYSSKDGTSNIQVVIEDETVWLNRNQLAEIFDRDVKTIGKHVNNIFKEGELVEKSVVAKIATTASDGKIYQVVHYNLDMIISIGYRVNSYKATQFRIWATGILKEYLIKGFAMDDERLKQGKTLFGKDYFSVCLSTSVQN